MDIGENAYRSSSICGRATVCYFQHPNKGELNHKRMAMALTKGTRSLLLQWETNRPRGSTKLKENYRLEQRSSQILSPICREEVGYHRDCPLYTRNSQVFFLQGQPLHVLSHFNRLCSKPCTSLCSLQSENYSALLCWLSLKLSYIS